MEDNIKCNYVAIKIIPLLYPGAAVISIFAIILQLKYTMKRVLLTAISYFLVQPLIAQPFRLTELLESEKSFKRDTSFVLHSGDGVQVEIPATLISGAVKGPTFTIIAGLHGMEYPSILSLLDFRASVDPEKLRGNLIIIPIANVPSFYQRTPFVNPLDQVNLNRVFPGSSSGTITEVMADFITQEIFSATDILLDMHGGDVGEDLIPFVCYYENEEFPEQTRMVSRLSEISGFNTIVSYPYVLPREEPAMYAFKQAVRQGIPALSIEIGGLGNWEKSEITLAKGAIWRMLKELNMYDPQGVRSSDSVKNRYNQQSYVSAPEQGIFYSDVKAGDQVEKNTEIGFITDLFGNKTATIVAPTSGVVLYKISSPPVNKGETMFCIGFNR